MKEEKWIASTANTTGRSRPPADPFRAESSERISVAAGRMERKARVGRGSAARRITRGNVGGKGMLAGRSGDLGKGRHMSSQGGRHGKARVGRRGASRRTTMENVGGKGMLAGRSGARRRGGTRAAREAGMGRPGKAWVGGGSA
jgi:hypothetical protein